MVNTMAPAVELVKPIAEFGTSEVTYSLAWFHSSSKLLACGMNGKSIKIYDLRGKIQILLNTLFSIIFDYKQINLISKLQYVRVLA